MGGQVGHSYKCILGSEPISFTGRPNFGCKFGHPYKGYWAAGPLRLLGVAGWPKFGFPYKIFRAPGRNICVGVAKLAIPIRLIGPGPNSR